MKRRVMSLLFAVLAAPVFAQEQGMEDLLQDLAMRYTTSDPVECLRRAASPVAAQTCIGVASGTCMEQEADGSTTFGMMACTMAETAAWDALLNAEYQKARARAARMDGFETTAEYAVRAARLLDAQRAWIAFRDAECALAYSEFGAGTMRVLGSAGCHLQMTAERTITLRLMFEEM